MISPSRPRESPGLAAQGRRRFRKEQIRATRVNTNGLTCPSGALDQVVTTGHIRRTRRTLFSLVGRIVPPNMPQDEEIQRQNNGDTLSMIEIHDPDQIKVRPTSSSSITNTKPLARPRPKAEGTALRAAMKCQEMISLLDAEHIERKALHQNTACWYKIWSNN